MINAYITKREAPEGYVAVTRSLAEALYRQGFQVVLCGSEVNQYNILERAHRGYVVSKQTATKPFALLIYDYMQVLPPSLGKHCVFYARASEADQVLYAISQKPDLVQDSKKRRDYASRH